MINDVPNNLPISFVSMLPFIVSNWNKRALNYIAFTIFFVERFVTLNGALILFHPNDS